MLICMSNYRTHLESSIARIKIIIMLALSLAKRWFSVLKVPLEAIKRLRE